MINKKAAPKKLSLILFLLFWVIAFVCFAQEDFIYDDQGRPDPFMALVTPDGRLLIRETSEADARIYLEGIIYDEAGRFYALINDEMLGVGDSILGYLVLEIEKNKVIFIKDDQQVEYFLKKEGQ